MAKTNIFPYPTDIYSFVTTGVQCTLSRDTSASPVGNTPLMMVSSGTDPQCMGGGSVNYKLSSAEKGETITASVYIKTDNPGACQIFIFGLNARFVLLTAIAGTLQATASWQQLILSTTFTTDVSYMSVRLDGRAVSGSTTWFDGLEVTRTTPMKYTSGKQSGTGRLPYNINDTDTSSFEQFQVLMNKSVNAGTTFTDPIVSTYSLLYTASGAYIGGVLGLNGDIHFVPYNANRGQKISIDGTVSTYSLLYTVAAAYGGGTLSSNGDIHFIPLSANRGQKIDANGVVSTYSLIYTASSAYRGGVLSPNGDIHFIPLTANRGQKIDINGTVSTYSLIYTGATECYASGVLAPNGDIHFIPRNAVVGQKVSSGGTVSTYSLIYTTTDAYQGGVLSPNGDIHFVPYLTVNIGQKISIDGSVSTYSLLTRGSHGGVLAPNGDIHFIPLTVTMGQKISSTGVVSTYSYGTVSAGTSRYGGVLSPTGDIHIAQYSGTTGVKISPMSALPFSLDICKSPYLNKL